MREIERFQGRKKIDYRTLTEDLFRAVNIFNTDFQLNAPTPFITFIKMERNILATYVCKDLDNEKIYAIVLNKIHLHQPFYRILRFFLHELIHLSMDFNSQSEFDLSHNHQFISRCLSCGLLSDYEGHELGHTEIFSRTLAKYGVSAPETEECVEIIGG